MTMGVRLGKAARQVSLGVVSKEDGFAFLLARVVATDYRARRFVEGRDRMAGDRSGRSSIS